MSTTAPWMIYGAYGYTGQLIIEVALARGLKPVLAGRDAQRTADLGRRTGLPVRIFSLNDTAAAARELQDMAVVVHAAGPFSQTARPMLEAMIMAGTAAGRRGMAYVDITGEIDVFEMIHGMQTRLQEHGLVAIPGVGFDVVPSDCLAALLKEKLPDATTLRLAFQNRGGGLSPGTAKTMVEGGGGRVRIDGRIVPLKTAKARSFGFPSGERQTVSIPWGDVSTAYYSTGIPHIETYAGVSPEEIRMLKLSAQLQPLMAFKPVRRLLQAAIGRYVKGPDAAARAKASSEFAGEVTNARGDSATLRLTTPEGYSLTAETTVRSVERLLAQPLAPGAYTPSMAFGASFVLDVPGVQLS